MAYTPPPKKSKAPIVLVVIGAVFVLLVGGCVALVAATGAKVRDAGSSTTSVGGTEGDGDAAAGIGTPVRDGTLEFVVNKVEPGPERLGTEIFGRTPQGKFVYLHLTVSNVGDKPLIFFGENQKMYDAQDREFSADGTAAFYLDDTKAFLEEINPGNKMEGIVVFDIPKDAQPVRVVLNDSPFGDGVTVPLG